MRENITCPSLWFICMNTLGASCSEWHRYPQHLATVARHQVVGRQAEGPLEHQPLIRDHLMSVSDISIRSISPKPVGDMVDSTYTVLEQFYRAHALERNPCSQGLALDLL
jgi:hypothetical protein